MVSFRKIQWTQHSEIKMRQYGLSKSKLIKILSKPERKEIGIVPGTLAVMMTNKKYGNKTKPLLKSKWGFSNRKPSPGETWLMYKDTKKERKIISAWRYPGVSKPGEQVPIPQEIVDAMDSDNELKAILES